MFQEPGNLGGGGRRTYIKHISQTALAKHVASVWLIAFTALGICTLPLNPKPQTLNLQSQTLSLLLPNPRFNQGLQGVGGEPCFLRGVMTSPNSSVGSQEAT